MTSNIFKLVALFPALHSDIFIVKFSPTSGWLVVGVWIARYFNKGVSMRLWEVESGKLLQTFSAHANDVNDVGFSQDGKWIASGSSDKTIGLWRSN